MRCLLPLPVTVMASPLPGAGTSPRASPSASEIRRPEPYSSASTAASRARIHCSRSSPARSSASVTRLAETIGKRLRQRLRHLRRAHGGERADLALAVAFKKSCERPHARQRPHQRAAADVVRAPRRHEGAHVLRREPGEFGQRRPAAEMLRQKSQELPDVALVGLDGLGRHPALGAKMTEPARHLGRHVAGGEGRFGGRLRFVLCLTRGELSHPLPSPFLNRPGIGQTCRMATPFVDVLVPVALDHTYSYRVPRELELKPGDIVAVPLGAREVDRRGLGRRRHHQARPAQPHEGCRAQARLSAAQARAAQVRRLDIRLHAEPARHGAAHVPAHGRSRPGAREGRRPAGRARAEAHDIGAHARAAAARRRHGAGQERGRARGRRVGRRHRRADRRGRAGDAGAAAGAGGAAARSRSRRA